MISHLLLLLLVASASALSLRVGAPIGASRLRAVRPAIAMAEQSAEITEEDRREHLMGTAESLAECLYDAEGATDQAECRGDFEELIGVPTGACAETEGEKLCNPEDISVTDPAYKAPARTGGAKMMSTEGEPLTDSQITGAAKEAGAPQAWPEQKEVLPGGAPTEVAEDVADGSIGLFNPKLIGYVGLPALVLVGQLFFTFSRDMLGDEITGPADMSREVGAPVAAPAPPAPAPAAPEAAAVFPDAGM